MAKISERLVIIEIIPFKNFKEKIRLTKQYSKEKVEIIGNNVVVTKEFESNDFIEKFIKK